jgi:multidrug efflux pump subunit AcrB
MDNEPQKTTTPISVIAIVAVVALLGVVVLTVIVAIPLQQQAEARGCSATSPAANASKTRCFHP